MPARLGLRPRAPSELVPLSPTGVAEQFAITEATLSAWSSLDDEELHPDNSPQDIAQLQGTAPGTTRHQGGVGGTELALDPHPVTSDKPPLPSAFISSSEKWGWWSLPFPRPQESHAHKGDNNNNR